MTARRWLTLLVLAACLAASCSVAVDGGGGQVTIDVPSRDDVDWRRTVSGFEVLGAGIDPSSDELAILERALAEIPAELVSAASVRDMYRIPVGESPHGTAAYALGPDVYLIDETFRDLGSGMVTFDLVRLLVHELTHTAQFSALAEADLERAADAGLDDPIPTSAFVASFADEVGWSDRGRAAGLPDWTLPDPSGTTSYGATAPEEDMAETVADLVTGTGPSVSADRVRWVAEWLGTTAARLTGGRPWVPAGSARIVSEEPLYDVEEVQRRATGETEVVSYSLPATAPGLDALRADLEQHLGARGVAGSLQPVADERVARVAGSFTRSDGVGYWVEVWDFRNAPGFADPPASPVITYVVLWR